MNQYVVSLLAAAFFLSACSQRAVYEGIRTDQRWQCDREPLSQQQECRERTSKTYTEYERERQELLE